jgi:hypothetical protein
MVFEDLINVFPFIWNWMYQNREFDRFTTDIAEPLSDRGGPSMIPMRRTTVYKYP